MSRLKIHRSHDNRQAHQLPPTVDRAFGLLGRAAQYAKQLECSVREFAVELRDLHAAGVNATDLRWLVAIGHVQHLIEYTRPQSKGRVFRRARNLTFTERSCFLPVPDRPGLATKSAAHGDVAVRENGQRTCADDGKVIAEKPTWDPISRTLYLGGLVVKQFRVLAPCQEAILAAFDEEHWPEFIYNPLAGRSAEDAKRQLHNTINALNRNQQNRLLQFRANGCGEAVGWSVVGSDIVCHPERSEGSHVSRDSSLAQNDKSNGIITP